MQACLPVALDIPVIVAAAGATKVLKSGTTITMDANADLFIREWKR